MINNQSYMPRPPALGQFLFDPEADEIEAIRHLEGLWRQTTGPQRRQAREMLKSKLLGRGVAPWEFDLEYPDDAEEPDEEPDENDHLNYDPKAMLLTLLESWSPENW